MKPKQEPVKLRPTMIRLPDALLKRAKHLCIERELSLQRFVSDAIAAHLKRLEGKEEK